MLHAHEITALVDVRSTPFSRYYAIFNAPQLGPAARAAGLAYVPLGKELGARREDPSSFLEGRVDYGLAANEPLFLEGLARLRRGLSRYTIALMCAEKDPTRCHRTMLITRVLGTWDNLEIQHVVGNEVRTHAQVEDMAMARAGVEPDMFRTREQTVELAYQTLNATFTRRKDAPDDA
jgi:hypothetical protein